MNVPNTQVYKDKSVKTERLYCVSWLISLFQQVKKKTLTLCHLVDICGAVTKKTIHTYLESRFGLAILSIYTHNTQK